MGRFSVWALLAGLILLVGGFLGLSASLKPVWTSAMQAPDDLPARRTPTSTPFQPQKPTRILPVGLGPTRVEPSPTAQETQPAQPVIPHFAGRFLDFPSPKARLHILPGKSLNSGQEIRLTINPAQECEFGTGKSCVSLHRGGQVILLTIHSGVGGEGEAFREAIEGSGLDEAGFSIGKIRTDMAALENVPVKISLGPDALGDLELAAVARVPAMDIQRYFDLPFDDALEMVAWENKPLRAALDSGEQLLIFEICGWHVPGEVWAQGSTATSASIYLGVIRSKIP